MERLSVGLKKTGRGSAKAGAATAGDKGKAAPVKGKFKLCRSKDPLPLLSKKQPDREMKPKAKFLMSVGKGVTTEKSNTKPSILAANSFMRPLGTENPPKKSAGFSFMKLQPKSTELGKTTAGASTKTTLPTFAGTKPLLGKISAKAPTKKATSETGTKEKERLFKQQPKGAVPFTFRAETKSSAAKKRKAAELFTQDKKTLFPSKTGRANPSFPLKNPVRKKDTDNQSGVNAENSKATGSSNSLATKMGPMRTKTNDGTVLKKRSLLTSTVEAPALKKGKTQDTQSLGNLKSITNKVIKSGSSSDASCENEDSSVSAPTSIVPPALKPAPTSQDSVGDGELSAVAASRDCREDCLSGIEEELAVKLLCTMDDDKEDEFLARVTVIEEFTDRVGLEQKELHNRLLDAHADVSESLLDALTDLMVEEGGIGIDKLDFDMNIDVDVGDAFLQDNEIQVIQ